ncbi:MAG: hypothetical protein OXG55_01945 [bacterium]|nr:hypothetical protein [bacterium]
MKELWVSKGSALRVLFAFDPRCHAILLLVGEKSGRWQEWHNWAIPPPSRRTIRHLPRGTASRRAPRR